MLSVSVRSLNGFPYNSYPGFYERSLSTACEIPGILDAKLKFRQCTTLEFPSHNDWCELIIVNYVGHQSNGYGVEFFYATFLPVCPIGFIKYTNKCGCDHILQLVGIFTCNINNRTILRLANSWITTPTNNYSHNYVYTVSKFF